jgi:hypothetical protein
MTGVRVCVCGEMRGVVYSEHTDLCVVCVTGKYNCWISTPTNVRDSVFVFTGDSCMSELIIGLWCVCMCVCWNRFYCVMYGPSL